MVRNGGKAFILVLMVSLILFGVPRYSHATAINPAQPLTVTKTATPTFTRTFAWSMSKSVDQTQIDIAQGGGATFNYVVTINHDLGTDSNWQVSGAITVTNPNTADVTGVSVADAVDNGGTCAVTGGTGVTVPASSFVTLSYTCTYASAPSPSSGTNTATATWSAQTLSNNEFLAGSSASGSATFSFTTPTAIVDGSVSVSDTLAGSLGTVSYTDPSPTTFTYSLTFTSDPAGTCTSHDNTATFTTSTTGTTGSASQSVKVCVSGAVSVPEFGSFYPAIALAMVAYFALSLLRQRDTTKKKTTPIT